MKVRYTQSRCRYTHYGASVALIPQIASKMGGSEKENRSESVGV